MESSGRPASSSPPPLRSSETRRGGVWVADDTRLRHVMADGTTTVHRDGLPRGVSIVDLQRADDHIWQSDFDKSAGRRRTVLARWTPPGASNTQWRAPPRLTGVDKGRTNHRMPVRMEVWGNGQVTGVAVGIKARCAGARGHAYDAGAIQRSFTIADGRFGGSDRSMRSDSDTEVIARGPLRARVGADGHIRGTYRPTLSYRTTRGHHVTMVCKSKLIRFTADAR